MFRKLGSFLKFSASSVVSFLVDYGLFTLLNAVVLIGLSDGSRELIATYGARIVSAVCNYLLNRNMVFRSSARGSAWRYALLAVVQAGISAALVSLLHSLLNSTALMETVIKIPVDLALFLVSYQLQKRWVFSERKR